MFRIALSLSLFVTSALLIKTEATFFVKKIYSTPDGHESHRTLAYYPLESEVPCGDGSRAGFYTDAYTNRADMSKKHHVINFMGGGACSNKASCDAIREQQPYMLSSMFEPPSIEGHTILSNDQYENPSMASFVKWNIPYCSQDLWLGDSRESSGVIRSGSLHVQAVLDHWLDEVKRNQVSIDTLVVSGVSAGTMAVLNHIEAIEKVTKAANVRSLRLLFDSSLYTDKLDFDFEQLFEEVVDRTVHPLCFKEYTDDIQPEKLSKLPCCLSTHCMLRHSESFTKWERVSENSTENRLVNDKQLMLIDSAYDSLQGFMDLSSISSNRNALPPNGLESVSGISSSIFNIGEFVGSRKERVTETLYGGERKLSQNILWVITSSPVHNVLIPTVELTSRLCQSGKQALPTSCNGGQDCVFSKYPGGITQVCNSTGSGLKIPVGNGYFISLWTTTESWKRVSVQGQSIEKLISNFVTTSSPHLQKVLPQTRSSGLLIDSCPGPNCVPSGSNRTNPAQSLIEIEDSFTPIPTWLYIIVSLSLVSIPVSYALSICLNRVMTDTTIQSENRSQYCGRGVFLKGLNVHSDRGEKILKNVSIDLKPSSLNCLLGKTGSGKSTLLSVLGCQLRSNLNVQYDDGSELNKIPSTFMRQMDLVKMENMSPSDFLYRTADIYDVNKKRLEFVLGLVKPFFAAKTRKDCGDSELTTTDPFCRVSIRECSGGQRRMLAIATALFQNTSFLLLDEPLTGIDSASSEKIVNLLNHVSKVNNVTILMTLHQPSDNILRKMDSVMVLGKGNVIFRGKFGSEKELRRNSSAADLIHDIIFKDDDKTRTSRDKYVEIKSKILARDEFNYDSDTDTKPTSSLLSDNDDQNVRNDKPSRSPLWQVQPIIKRFSSEKELRRNSSAADLIHDIIVKDDDKTRTSRDKYVEIKSKTLARDEFNDEIIIYDGDTDTKPTSSLLSDNDDQNVRNDKPSRIPLWQVQPIIKRLYKECPPDVQDVFILPFCVLIISLWGRLDSDNPMQRFLITSTFTFIPCILFQTRMVVNWHLLDSHLWDLEDNRISCLSYVIASGIQMLFIPILSIFVSFFIAYMACEWEWESFLPVSLFSIMTCVSALSLGKTLCAALKTYQRVAGSYSVYLYLSVISSGLFVNPARVPQHLHWTMYLSLSFWGISGAQLTYFEYAHGSEPECLTFASCLVQNRTFMAQVTGYGSVTTTYTSMLALCIATIVFVLAEYCILSVRVSPRKNYMMTKRSQEILHLKDELGLDVC